MKNGKNNKTSGITLVALVVTIVVLLILAGITITYVFGDNSVFKQASDAKLETELAKIEEQAGIIYADKFLENKGGSVRNREIIDKLIENGDKIEIRHVGATAVTKISLEPSEVSMDQSASATINVKLEGSEDENFYYAVIDEKYYKIKFQASQIEIEREATTPEGDVEEPKSIEIGTGYDEAIVANAQVNQNEKTIEIRSGISYGETTITVKYGSRTATCKVTVKEQETNWADIAEVAQKIATDSSVTNNSTTTPEYTLSSGNKMKITVGDILKAKYNGEIRRVRVLGFKHDDLVDTGVYGTGVTATKASISFEFYDCLGTHNMNSSATNENGWAATEMRTYLEGTEGRGKLSNNSYLKQVKKKYIKTYNSASSVTTSNDYLWLLSCSEIFKDGMTSGYYGRTIAKEGEQYLYYKNNAKETYNGNSTSRVKFYLNSKSAWWLRSPGHHAYKYYYCDVDIGGTGGDIATAQNGLGVAPRLLYLILSLT